MVAVVGPPNQASTGKRLGNFPHKWAWPPGVGRDPVQDKGLSPNISPACARYIGGFVWPWFSDGAPPQHATLPSSRTAQLWYVPTPRLWNSPAGGELMP